LELIKRKASIKLFSCNQVVSKITSTWTQGFVAISILQIPFIFLFGIIESTVTIYGTRF